MLNFYACIFRLFGAKNLGGGRGEGTWPLPMLRPCLRYFILNFILTYNTYSHVYTGNRPLWVVFSFVFLILNICPFFNKICDIFTYIHMHLYV